MNSILEPWFGIHPPALAFLVEATAKGTLLLALAALAAFLLRNRSAAVRHLVWGVALAGLVALPALLALMPAWRVAVPVASSAEGSPAKELPVANNSLLATRPSTPVTAPEATALESYGDPTAGTTLGHAPALATAKAAPRPIRWRDAILALWLAGFTGVLALFVTGHLVLRLTTRDARPLRDRAWQDQALAAAEQLRLDLPFALLQSPTATLPVSYGLLRPRVLLPAGAEDWPADRRRSVLLHELAHVQRHDCLTQALAQLACAVFWFHPAVWWAASRMRIERERACDDLVLGADTRASAYADHLLEVVRTLRGTRLAALGAVAFARPSQFEGRLLAVLDPRRDRRGVSRRLALPAFTFASLALLPIAALELDGVPASHAATGRDFARSSRASSVIVTPETGRLEERLAWVEGEASRSRAGDYWLGWQIEPWSSSDGDMLGDTGGLEISTLDDDSGCFSLEDVLAGSRTSTWPAPRERRSGAMAFLFHATRAGEPSFDRFRLQSAHLPAALDQRPLYWAGTITEDQSLGVLRGFLAREPHLGIRRELIHALAQHGSSEVVVPLLEEIIGSDEPAMLRASATEGLGRHPSDASLERLVDLARNDRSSHVKRSAVEALGQFKTAAALDALMDLARDTRSDASMRRHVFDALGEEVALGADEAEGAGKGSGYGSGHGYGNLKDEVMAKERTKLADEHAKMAREYAKMAADAEKMKHSEKAKLDQQARLEMKHAYEKSKRESKSDASYDLDGNGYDPDPNPDAEEDPDADAREELEALKEMSEEDEREDPVQRQAVESLGRFPEAQALPRLVEIAGSHPIQGVRREAVDAIARYGTPSAFAPLRQIARNAESPMREAAIEGMGRHFPAELVLPELMEIAKSHHSRRARVMAVESIGRTKSPRSAAYLEEIVRGKYDPQMQHQAIEQMGRRGGDGAVERLVDIARRHPQAEVQRFATEMIGRCSDPGRARVLLNLARTHPDAGVQRMAVESLGRVDQEEVLPMLGEIASSHPNGDVRRQAVESMGRRDPEAALPILEKILNTKTARSKR